MHITDAQLEQVNRQIQRLIASDNFYGRRLKEAGITGVASEEDFLALPFSEKQDLREAYPLGLSAVPQNEIVRIHSSSGTTGTPVIIPYTQKDVDDWAIQFARCYEYAGVTPEDRVQITPGYGLWTAGIGEHNHKVRRRVCEKLGSIGVKLDFAANEKAFGEEALISAPDSKVKVALIPTEEELMIALDTMNIVAK